MNAWEQRKFSDIAKTRRGLTYKPTNIVDKGIRVLRSSNINEDTFVYGNDDVFVDENVVNIPCVQNGDILITSANGSSRLVGKHAIIRNLHDNSAVHGGFMLIASSSNSEFLNASMGSQWYSEFLSLYVAGGNGAIGNLNKNDLDMQVVFVPRAAEQCQIGTYFRTLDHLITLHQRKCEDTKKLKKYMLQKMFPQNGSKVPEIRFKGFTDDWEQHKFGELAEYKKGPFGSAITKSMFVPKSDDSVKVYEQQNAINKDSSLERYFLPKEYVYTKLKAFEVHSGDIIVSCAGTIGEIYEIPDNAEYGVINQALMRVRVDEKIVDKRMFIIAFSNMINEFTRTHSNGSAIKNIPPFADLKPMKVLMPSMEEQKVISECFEKMDYLITLHQNKCDELKKIKKYMLQNMFV